MRTLMPAGPAIEVRRLEKTYPGGVEAVRGIDFEVERGEVFGLARPERRRQVDDDRDAHDHDRPDRRQAPASPASTSAAEPLAARRASSVVFQDAVVDRSLTGRRNLDVHARLWGVEPAAARPHRRARRDARPRRAARPARRDLQRRPAAAARDRAGARLRAAGAVPRRADRRARPAHPPRAARRDRGPARPRRRSTILLTTHYLDEAERLCDRVAIMHAGRIVALDTPAALLAGLGSEIVELRVDGDAGAALAALRARGVAGDDAFAVGSTLTVPLHDRPAADAIARDRRARHRAAAIATRRPTLDDVYLRLTGGRLAGSRLNRIEKGEPMTAITPDRHNRPTPRRPARRTRPVATLARRRLRAHARERRASSSSRCSRRCSSPS